MLDMDALIGKEVVTRDNEISINGRVIGKLTDKEAQKVFDIVKGFLSLSENNNSNMNTNTSKPAEKKVRDYTKITPPTDVTVGIKWLDDSHFITDGYFGKATSMAFHKMLDGMISFDSDYIRDDVYKRDYGQHKVGEHKKGAWKLEKASDTFNQSTKTFIVTASAIQGARDDIADRIAKREARLG